MVGASLLYFFHRHPEAMPPHLTFSGNGDAFFPYYVSHFLPTGIAGLVVASLLSASMSCLSSGTNATITVLMTDFVGTTKAGATRGEAAKLRITRLLSFAIGLVVIAGSIEMGSVHGNLVEVANKTVNLLVCPIFGLFFLAIFVKFSTPFGAMIGTLYSIASAVLIGYWDVLTGSPAISFLWIMPVSFAISVAGGCLFSLLPTRGRPPMRMAAWTAATVAPLFVVVAWLVWSVP